MRSLAAARLTIRRFVHADLDDVVRLFDDCFGEAPRASRVDWLEWTVRNYDALAALRQPPYGDYAVTLGAAGEPGPEPQWFQTVGVLFNPAATTPPRSSPAPS